MKPGTIAIAVAIAVASIVEASSSVAQDMPVPIDQQAAIFKRAFAYDRTFSGSPRVFVVYTEQESDTVNELMTAFRNVGVAPSAVEVNQLTDPAAGPAVVYVAPATDPSLVESFCTANGVLSISGVPAWAQEGKVSMALGVSKYNKAKIIVNLKRLSAERHQISSDLLKLSEVIR